MPPKHVYNYGHDFSADEYSYVCNIGVWGLSPQKNKMSNFRSSDIVFKVFYCIKSILEHLYFLKRDNYDGSIRVSDCSIRVFQSLATTENGKNIVLLDSCQAR